METPICDFARTYAATEPLRLHVPGHKGTEYLGMERLDIFLDYGAVNACNMDGGSSSLMWYQGDYINQSASVLGIRNVPSTFLVLPQGGDSNG